MSWIYGVFAYPDGDATAMHDDLFEAVRESPDLTERISERRITTAADEDISFGVYAPTLDSNVSITPENVPCIVLRRSKGGVFYDESEGRDAYVDLLVTIYEHLPSRPALGYGLDVNQAACIFDEDEVGPLVGERPHEFTDSAWVMFVTPDLVDEYGKETLFDLPARRVEELDDGTVLVVAPGDPADYTEHWDIGEELGLPGPLG
ncbi:hypothetical protein [Haloarchaeobius amylolyticus]|uniref:hypothetical protein n=1 Tax=Haloarchaeobius amylolyticus TaxID=1198296 RepID=UPI00226D659F|nr:hypothetical protein [Haloarchaeobius amylolyticus]